MSRHIVKRHSLGLRQTHNGDGRFTRCWRLWSDGTVERTSSSSRYQVARSHETIPAPILEAAQANQIIMKGARP